MKKSKIPPKYQVPLKCGTCIHLRDVKSSAYTDLCINQDKKASSPICPHYNVKWHNNKLETKLIAKANKKIHSILKKFENDKNVIELVALGLMNWKNIKEKTEKKLGFSLTPGQKVWINRFGCDYASCWYSAIVQFIDKDLITVYSDVGLKDKKDDYVVFQLPLKKERVLDEDKFNKAREKWAKGNKINCPKCNPEHITSEDLVKKKYKRKLAKGPVELQSKIDIIKKKK